MYDVIVIGARVAGSPTAMLLARNGFKVLLVDRANFPSDTLSTHLVQLKGAAALQEWGLLERVLATNCPPIKKLSFNQGRHHLQGKYFPLGEVDASLCPRRTVLDKILVDAAVEAGVELRQDLIVEDLLFEDGKATGIRGRIKSNTNGDGVKVEEKAPLVIGADGKHSLVAKQGQAEEYHVQPVQECAYYSYWEGFDLEGGELYLLEKAMVGIMPTNDQQTIFFTGYPVAEFNRIREDVEGNFWKTMEAISGLTERLRSGRQVGRFYGSTDLPGFYRRPYGPGWALVGDAGLTMDPVTGQGIGNAFRDAERLAKAVEVGFSGETPIEKAMARYEKERNTETLPMYEFTNQAASFVPVPRRQEILIEALEDKPTEVERFNGMLSGSVSVKEFFSMPSLIRIMGIGGMMRVMRGNMQGAARRKAPVNSRPEAS